MMQPGQPMGPPGGDPQDPNALRMKIAQALMARGGGGMGGAPPGGPPGAPPMAPKPPQPILGPPGAQLQLQPTPPPPMPGPGAPAGGPLGMPPGTMPGTPPGAPVRPPGPMGLGATAPLGTAGPWQGRRGPGM